MRSKGPDQGFGILGMQRECAIQHGEALLGALVCSAVVLPAKAQLTRSRVDQKRDFHVLDLRPRHPLVFQYLSLLVCDV